MLEAGKHIDLKANYIMEMFSKSVGNQPEILTL